MLLVVGGESFAGGQVDSGTEQSGEQTAQGEGQVRNKTTAESGAGVEEL